MNNKIFCTTYNYNNKVENITFKSPYYTFYQYFSLETCILPFIIFYIRNKQNPPTRHQIHSTPSNPSPEILSSLQNSNGQPRQRPRPLYGKFSVALQKFQSPRCNRRTPVQKKGTTSNENVLYVYTYMCVCIRCTSYIPARFTSEAAAATAAGRIRRERTAYDASYNSGRYTDIALTTPTATKMDPRFGYLSYGRRISR